MAWGGDENQLINFMRPGDATLFADQLTRMICSLLSTVLWGNFQQKLSHRG